MKTDDVVVKKSDIAGVGVFADREFREGEVVMRWDMSVTLTKEQLDKLPTSEKCFVMQHEGGYVLNQLPEKFVNHSCDANTFERDCCDVASRDIRKGEEITTDYGKASFSKPHFKCTCGSKKCKGLIRRF